jgi:hypothetical protein
MGSMVLVMALNTDFGLSVPYRFRFDKQNNGRMTKKELPEPEKRNDALAWHFKRIAGERSIEALRVQMKESGYDIGAGTLWRLSRGDEGVRAQSIKKLAAYDRKEPDELLRMPEEVGRRAKAKPVAGPTPPGQRFDSVTGDELQMLMAFRGMSDEDRAEMAEEMKKRAAKWSEIVSKVLAQTRAKQDADKP